MVKGVPAMLTGLFFLSLSPGLSGDSFKDFKDIPKNHWAIPAIKEITAKGLLKGKGKGKFSGETPMNRYEMAVLLQTLLHRIETLEGEVRRLRGDSTLEGSAAPIAETVAPTTDGLVEPPSIPRPSPLEPKPYLDQKVEGDPIAPHLVYSYERPISGMFAHPEDDFRNVVEERVDGHVFSLVIKCKEAWDNEAKKSDLLTLGFQITLYRDGAVFQDFRSPNLNLQQVGLNQELHSFTLPPFTIKVTPRELFREGRKISRVKLGIDIFAAGSPD